MAKKSGLFTLLSGVAMGAAAVFLSKEENRIKTKKAIKGAAAKAKKAKAEYKKDPQAFKKKLKSDGKKLAKKALAGKKKSAGKSKAKK